MSPYRPRRARPRPTVQTPASPDSSATLAARSLRSVWHPCTQMKRHEAAPPRSIVAGDGAWLIDSEGRRILDAVSSWWVNLFGHGRPEIKAAIAAQMDRIEHVMLAGLTHEPVVRLSERLAERTGLGHAQYASDGACANEIALKLSAHYWRNLGQPQKNRYIALRGSYHGETIGALGVTDVELFRSSYFPLLRPAATVPAPDARAARDPAALQQAIDAACRALDEYLRQQAAHTAALIVEPLVQCAAGFVFHPPQYLRRVRELCDTHQVHLVADEIAVGMGRTGSFTACEQAGVRPDLMCLGKGLTGGFLPLSAVLCTEPVFQAFYDDDIGRGFLHSHSYTGNPLACAAALATLDLLDEPRLAANRALAERLDRLFEPLYRHPRLRHGRRAGMIWAWDVEQPPADFARRFGLCALERGVLLRPIGSTLYFMPPYVIAESDAEHLLQATLGALEHSLRLPERGGPAEQPLA